MSCEDFRSEIDNAGPVRGVSNTVVEIGPAVPGSGVASVILSDRVDLSPGASRLEVCKSSGLLVLIPGSRS